MAWKTVRLWLMAAERQKKIIFGMEWQNVVDNGRLPSPTRRTTGMILALFKNSKFEANQSLGL